MININRAALAALFAACVIGVPSTASAGDGSVVLPGLILGISAWIFLLLLIPTVCAFLSLLRWGAKVESTRRMLRQISTKSRLWDEDYILDFVEWHFKGTLLARGRQDLDALAKYLHPTLLTRWKEEIEGMKARGTKERFGDVVIKSVEIINIKDFRNDELDEFSAAIKANMSKATREASGRVVVASPDFFEFWTYENERGRWMLREISGKEAAGKFLGPNVIESTGSAARPKGGSRRKTQGK